MRISTGQIYRQGVNSMLETQSSLAKTQLQLSTGKRILAPSDDPSAATRVLKLEQAIATSTQYQRNADHADARLALEESIMINAGDILQRVRELAVQAGNDTLSAADRAAIALEVQESLEGMIQLANTQDSNDEYLFAGYQVGTEPFSHDGAGNFTYNGDQGVRSLQIGPNRKVSIGDSGDAVFMRVDDGAGGIGSIFETLYEFAADLNVDNPSPITLTRLDSALDAITTTRSSIGARMNAIENQRGANESFSLLMQENRSQLQDLDYTEAVSRFEQQMLALQASQQSYIKIQGLSLFNYL